MTSNLMAKMESPYGPVLVTGATGYVAGWIVQFLLDAGVTVHGGVRDPDNAEKIDHLLKMAESAPGQLRLFKADLLNPGSHEDAMQGCRVVMHTASPFIVGPEVTDPERELVKPALLGTRDILETASRVEGVERIVLTGSTAAISDAGAPLDKVATEKDWNDNVSLEIEPYAYSKVLAEREAWKLAEAQDQWKLVVMNPALIVGAGTAPTQTSGSFSIFRSIGDGTFSEGLPPGFDAGVVDVRDVADAHLRAAYMPSANGRHILSAEVHSLNDMANMLKEEFGDDDRFAFPPDTPWDPEALHWRADTTKSKRELGIEYRPVDAAIIEMFKQIWAGH